ncbi:MAG TPA: response regulator transcription factor [Dongiaceae bacterium]|nr:response regulator transcription factor [Dongiaceae bacterium]
MPVRILIADDNAAVRRALRGLFESVDHWEVIDARDGQEAVVKSIESRPDAIVLDLAMPQKDGLAAAKEISALLPDIPILMCTMHMSTLVQAEALKSGIRQVFSKGDSSLLVPAIRQLLGLEAPPVPQIRESVAPVVAGSGTGSAGTATSTEGESTPARPSLPEN